MASIRAGAGARQHLPSGLAQTEDIVEFAIGKEPTIGGDLGTVELELEATVKCQAKAASCVSPASASIQGTHSQPYAADNFTKSDARDHHQTQSSGKCGITALSRREMESR